MMPIAELIAGVVVASALIRWTATIRSSGWRALAGAGSSLQLRLQQYGSFGWIAWMVPVGLAAVLIGVEVAVQLLFSGAGGLLAVAVSVMATGVATLALWACPPTIVFLGSSEPGSYKHFRYLSARYSWITVSALNEWDDRATESEYSRRSITARLLPRRVQRSLRWLAPPALESLRATDVVWEEIVGRALALCQFVVIDLRSAGLFVRAEFVQLLRGGYLGKTVAIVRDDGTSCIDGLIADRPAILTAFRSTLRSDELRHALHRGWTPSADDARPSPDAPLPSELAVVLADRLERRHNRLKELHERIVASVEPHPDLDRDIVAAFEPATIVRPPVAVTSSAKDAAAFIRRVAPDAQYSLHLVDSQGRFGAGLGREQILSSFRTVESARTDHATGGLALIDALVRSELGYGIGTGALTHVLVRFSFPEEQEAEDERDLLSLLVRVRADTADPELDDELVASVSSNRGDLHPTVSLDDAFRLVRRWSVDWRTAVYVDATDGTAFAEVHTNYGAGYKVAVSLDADGTAGQLSPARAVLSGWIKGRLGAWDFYGQAAGSMRWCVGTPGARTELSEADRVTLRTRGRYIGRLRSG
jgi:hypothetical protein